jgi:hypothetical protein
MVLVMILGLLTVRPVGAEQIRNAPVASSESAPGLTSVPSPSLWAGSYWNGFIQHWEKMLKNQDAVILVVLGCGALGVFIITRAKWKK